MANLGNATYVTPEIGLSGSYTYIWVPINYPGIAPTSFTRVTGTGNASYFTPVTAPTTTSVSVTLATSYSVLIPVSKSLQTSYIARTSVTSYVETSYNVITVAPVANSIDTAWSSLTTVNKILTGGGFPIWNPYIEGTQWALLEALPTQVSSTIDTSWSLAGRTSASIPTSYSILTSVQDTVATYWSIAAIFKYANSLNGTSGVKITSVNSAAYGRPLTTTNESLTRAVWGDVSYSTAASFSAPSSAKFTVDATARNAFMYWDVPATQKIYTRMYLRIPSGGTSVALDSTDQLIFNETDSGNFLSLEYYDPTVTQQHVLNFGVGGGYRSKNLSTNTWYRIETELTPISITYRVYVGDSLTLYDTKTKTFNNTGAIFTRQYFGANFLASNNNAGYFYIDEPATSNDTWIGPLGVPTTPVTSTKATAWSVRSRVSDSTVTSWTTRVPIFTALTTSWNIQSAGLVTSLTVIFPRTPGTFGEGTFGAGTFGGVAVEGTNWNAYTAEYVSVNRSILTSWSVRNPVTSSKATYWSVLKSTATSLETDWRTLSALQSTIGTEWQVVQAVTSSKVTSWAISSAIFYSVGTFWNTLATGSVSGSVATTWNVHIEIFLTGQSDGSSSAMAEILRHRLISGTSDGQSDVLGDSTRITEKILSGSSDGDSTVNGSISAATYLVAYSNGVSLIIANVIRDRKLISYLEGNSSIGADVHRTGRTRPSGEGTTVDESSGSVTVGPGSGGVTVRPFSGSGKGGPIGVGRTRN